jgi:hypothetical protein
MCLMCQEEDLYFLYLERMERERRAARGEVVQPDASWLWRSAREAQAAEAPAKAPSPAVSPFACDVPEAE